MEIVLFYKNKTCAVSDRYWFVHYFHSLKYILKIQIIEKMDIKVSNLMENITHCFRGHWGSQFAPESLGSGSG